MSEKINALEDELGQAAEVLSHWESLLEHPGWHRLATLVESNIGFRMPEIMRPLGTFGETLAQEFAKGEISGMKMILILPQAQIEMLRADHKRVNVQLEQEMEHEITEKARSGSRVDDDNFWRE